MAWQGFFKPICKEKYLGNANNIVYRSSLEFKYMRLLDSDDNVIGWASEEFFINYYDPISKRTRRYFPDFFVKKNDGTIIVVEIKPASQCSPPKSNKKQTKRLLREAITYVINDAKWKAAEKFCVENGWSFVVITERDLKTMKCA